MNRNYVAYTSERFDIFEISQPEFVYDICRKTMIVEIMQLHIERLQASQYCQANPAGGNCAHIHALQVISPLGAIGDVPALLNDPFIRWDVVADERQNLHHRMLGDADAVA